MDLFASQTAVLLASGTQSQRQGGGQSGTTKVEGTRLHKGGFVSAEEGEEPHWSPQVYP